ncbi:MAG: alpha/beta hydrolase [Deltaproteobacteria bacterium]|nr:alpha/beta hydrolase [Deltaproteobacteria bacterium]
MYWRLAVAGPDYLMHFGALLRDPVYLGRQAPRGHDQPILLIPGFLAGDWTLWTMAGWLNRLGYRAYFSGLNWNVDCPNQTGDLLQLRLDTIMQETGQPVTIIGHSLGGMLGRFLGASFPDQIRHVITLGSPIDGTMQVNPLVPLAFRTIQTLRRNPPPRASACGSQQCTCRFAESLRTPFPAHVDFTSIFTKQDEVVDWHACIDKENENWEVSGSHISLIVNREVYRILAATLAADSPSEG